MQKAIQVRLAERRTAFAALVAGRSDDSDEARRALAELESTAQLAPKLDRLLTTTTRSAKTTVHTRRDLDAHWRETARPYRVEVGRLRGQPRVLGPADRNEVMSRLTEFDARFVDRDARAVALEASVGASIERALGQLEQLQIEHQVLELTDQSKTTRVHRCAEEQTVAIARHLSAERVSPLQRELVAEEAGWLNEQLGGGLSREQRTALELACSDRPLVVIEGQAGTGKSTTLAGVARAHRAAEREVIVVSTGGLAAERLAGELEAANVPTRGYSLAAFDAALDTGALELTRASTVIHDEAALASTREQRRLLTAVEAAGARLIEVGDPRQSPPIGAGGLWPRLEQATGHERSRVELTRNVRARDPLDRRDQAQFRDGEAEAALRSYAQRGRVWIEREPRRAEDAALDAAHLDRARGLRTAVIAQTTNEHLDELNARAQAIRHQAGELGSRGVRLPGRPYSLYRGDEVQVRRTVHHDEVGALRNGSTASVADAGADRLILRLSSGHEVELDRDQIDAADLRLAYVQHPFPAQGQTTETTHLIVAQHATQEGSYVALTRARDRTNTYAAPDELELDERRDALAALAERMSRSEPEIPSIDLPFKPSRDRVLAVVIARSRELCAQDAQEPLGESFLDQPLDIRSRLLPRVSLHKGISHERCCS